MYPDVEGRIDIKPGWFFCVFSASPGIATGTTPYNASIYVLESFDRDDAHLVHARKCDTGEEQTFSLFKLLHPPPGKPKTFLATAGTGDTGLTSSSKGSNSHAEGAALPAPIFAPTYQRLLEELEALHPGPAPSASTDISPPLIGRARYILEVVQKVRRLLQDAERKAARTGERFNYTRALKEIITELQGSGEKVSIATYYRYLDKQLRSGGNESRLAALLHRSTYKHHKLDDAQLHMVDAIILRLGRLRKKAVYDLLRALHRRTGGRWVDLRKCMDRAREDLVEELFDTDTDMADILANPEKALLLTPVRLPSRAWFYAHFNWFTHLPDLGEEVVTSRYGAEAWEHNFLVFDSFVRLATLPLQYVFTDHTPIDVFTVDEKGSRKVTRLWLTVFLDAWSRSVLGFTLLAEHPCIESIQMALRHALWPKDPKRELLQLYARGIGAGERDDFSDLAHLRDISAVQTTKPLYTPGNKAGQPSVANVFNLASLSDALWESDTHSDGGSGGDGNSDGDSSMVAAHRRQKDTGTGTGSGGERARGKGTKQALAKLIGFGGFEGLAGLPLAGYGIPSQLFLDNAWAHHSHSLKQLAVEISDNGMYSNIELRWRPPYRARYGALIERFFGNLSGQLKEFLRHAGAIQSSHPKDVREAAEAACLLYEDIYIIIYLLILSYQHTPHSELNGMTPHEKWLSGMLTTHPHVPPLTPETERLFWRLYPDTRTVTREGVSLFNLHYTAWPGDPNAMRLLRRDIGGKSVRYSIRYRPQDISQIALFKDGKWVGDLWAKRLLDPAVGSKTMPKWKWDAAKRQAGSPRAALDMLGFTQAVAALVEERQDEQKQADRSAASSGGGGQRRKGAGKSAGRSQAPVERSTLPRPNTVSTAGADNYAPPVSPGSELQDREPGNTDGAQRLRAPRDTSTGAPSQDFATTDEGAENAYEDAYTQLLSGFARGRQH
jgi:hypothetical protein